LALSSSLAGSGEAAAQAGLQPGDILVRIGEHAVTDVAFYTDALVNMNPGDRIAVQFYRGNQQLTVNVTLGEAKVA
jgi:S1-C subfamily serine protease